MPRLVLALAIAVVHGRDLAFRFTSLDDLTLIVDDQPFLTSRDALWRAFGRTYFHVVDAAHAYYRPIVTASYALDAHAFGAAPSGYHATNVLLHLLATWLVHSLLVRMRFSGGIAFFGALTFAVHPALVPAVAWIPGRNDLLLTVFALISVLAHARARDAFGWRVAHLASFGFALFTKETAIVIPLVVTGWAHFVERAEARGRADDIAKWSGWVCIVTSFVWARHRVLADDAAAIDWHAPLRHLSVLVTSAGKLLLPVNLAPIATLEDSALWPGVVATVALATVVGMVRRRGTTRMPVIAFGVFWYVVTLGPALFVPGSLALENRLYWPAVGTIVVLAELADAARLERTVVAAFGSVWVLALAALGIGNASAYRDPLTFGKAAVAGAPHSALAHFTLGQARQLHGELDVAVGEYLQALALDPSEPIVHNNLAVIHMKRGNWRAARTELEAELRVNAGSRIALANLAIVDRRLGD